MDTMIELRLHSCTHCLWKETAVLLPMPVKFMLDSKEMLAAEASLRKLAGAQCTFFTEPRQSPMCTGPLSGPKT